MDELNLKKIVSLRHTLHSCPELSMKERETPRQLMAFLKENTGFRIFDRGGWFYAVKPGKVSAVAFRAELDALSIQEGNLFSYRSQRSGVSHKCGHDGHCAALCGLALELDALETESSIYLLFQPGEETGEGARRCVDLIRSEGIREIYAFHNLEGYPLGSIVYRAGLTQPASEGLCLCLQGKNAHAALPEAGRNPAEILANLVLFARKLSRSDDEEMRLCTVTGISLGSGDYGVSPGYGEINLTLRAEQEAEMKRMEKALVAYAANLAEERGIALRYEISDAFPETRNHGSCLERVIRAAEELDYNCIPMQQMWRASEDFGHYLKACPGAIFYIGNGENYPPLHTPDYDFNDYILETAVELLKKIALSRR